MKAMLGFAALAALASVPSVASASPYVRGQVGYGIDNPADATFTIGGITATTSDEIDSVTSIDGAVGSKLGPFRVEAELNYTVLDGADGDSAEASTLAGFANVFFDFPTPGLLKPYVGAGVGYGTFELEDAGLSESDSGTAWHLDGGVNFEVGPAVTLNVGYRYLSLPGFEFAQGGDRVTLEVESHQLVGGVRFGF